MEGARSWGTLAQLQPVLAKWVAAQAAGFHVWVGRQLEREDWKPLGAEQPHSASARELRRMVLESLDALFGMGIPLPAEAVAMHLEALEGVFAGYLKQVRQRLGPWQRLVPPVPPLVRYKREVSVKQEDAESALPGLPTRLPPAGSKRWLDSVPRIEAEPSFREVGALTPEAVAVMLASLGYLEATLQARRGWRCWPMALSVGQRWQDASRLAVGSRAPSNGDDGGGITGSGGGAANGGARGGHSRGGSTAGSSGGGGANPFQPGSSPAQGRGGDNPFLGGSPAGGARGAGAANPFGPTDSGAGGRGGASGPSGAFTESLLRGGGGGGAGPGAGAGAGGAAAELLGSLLEGASQALRHGMEYVAKWLAARVVWWDMRGEWCELVYRHRVCNTRIDFVEQRLGDVGGRIQIQN
ncbi:hypothetical protein MNEG_14949 [Monoraphidium neglectum]|uniref:MHD1 domain-containing protein n=1 Tax=Monoraphidium neglectum TaxID=145388 RepID=A0A0D2LMH4_9CHLO|nr:hypothetical protein MNEG_14949 [Monoraphidium neglectum]KIY93014.1 hypothetical protein MNEG_14949 [Monoraphidium neglectum]|eukprot:XP_013892034.1 hypothetical protein MNEG_14949 [Monoraphidium neglectum]